MDLSGTATASSNIENSLVTGIMQAGITAVAIASITTILPVVLQSFNTTMKICDALSLNWSVSDANNFSYFEVERSSDGRAYTVEAKISYDPSKSTYTFSNHGLLQGNYYYRLKMVDKDGASKYGNTVSVKVNCALSQILVYPNPVLHTVTVRGLKGKENLQLFNAVGQRLLNVTANGYQFDINMSTYIRGIYTLYINTKNGEKVVIKKIVKVGR